MVAQTGVIGRGEADVAEYSGTIGSSGRWDSLMNWVRGEGERTRRIKGDSRFLVVATEWRMVPFY